VTTHPSLHSSPYSVTYSYKLHLQLQLELLSQPHSQSQSVSESHSQSQLVRVPVILTVTLSSQSHGHTFRQWVALRFPVSPSYPVTVTVTVSVTLTVNLTQSVTCSESDWINQWFSDCDSRTPVNAITIIDCLSGVGLISWVYTILVHHDRVIDLNPCLTSMLLVISRYRLNSSSSGSECLASCLLTSVLFLRRLGITWYFVN